MKSPRGKRQGWLRRGFRRVMGLVVGHEGILVTLMAAMVCLSAFAVWQATRASDEADEVAAQIRATDAQQQLWESQLQATLNYDAQVVTRYCDTLVDYNVAQYQLLGLRPNAAGMIPAHLDLQTLAWLTLGGVPAGACDPDNASGGPEEDRYEIARAEAAILDPPGGTQRLEAAAQDFRVQELWLMAAGLLFALALFGLIGIDVLSDRAHRPRSLSGSGVRLGQATAFLVAATAFLLGIGITAFYGEGIYVVVLLIGLAALAAWRGLSLRRKAATARSRLDVSHPQWWAEVIGALTLVAFSATALGLSTVSGHERLDRAESEAQRTASSALSEQGQLAAMRDLFAVAELAETDAAMAADLGNKDAEVAADERRNARESFLGDLEDSIRDQLAFRGTATTSNGCPTQVARARHGHARTLWPRSVIHR